MGSKFEVDDGVHERARVASESVRSGALFDNEENNEETAETEGFCWSVGSSTGSATK